MMLSLGGESRRDTVRPPAGQYVSSMMGEAVQITLTLFFGADLAAAWMYGSSSWVSRNGAMALVPISSSNPCFVLLPFGAAPIPALLNRRSSLVSCAANALAAGLIVVKSARSRWMYFTSPEDLVASVLMVLMASSAFVCERLSMYTLAPLE